MITAIDTNVLLDVFGADARFGERSAQAVRRCFREGALVACEVVWAEAATAFPDGGAFRHAMSDLAVGFEPMSEVAALGAAEARRHYRARGGLRTRIASDFLIGAHARLAADRLLTRDRGFYKQAFHGLKVLDPSTWSQVFR